MPRVFLSKSRIIYGLQCHRRLWLQTHRPDLVVYDAPTQRRLDSGHVIGEHGRRLYDGGTLVAAERGGEALRQTERALREAGDDFVLYEPAFRYAGVLVRADILARRDGRLRLVEVKSSASVKEYHLNDIAIQAWVLRGAGQQVREAAVAHVDTGWTYRGDGDYRGLLVEEDVTADVEQRLRLVWGWVDELRAVVAGAAPEVKPGPHCRQPFGCPLVGLCDAGDPERAGQVTATGEAELDGAASRELLGLAHPRFYLDFETIGFAVPLWAGTRPYEQLPFQFSLHVEHQDGRLEQHAFLDVSGAPPMRALSEALIAAAGETGPVFAYSSYEHTCLQALARRFPDLSPALLAVDARLVDLYEITRRNYRHPAMNGSWSLKSVLPTIAPELDYGALAEVRDGEAAQAAYLETIHPETGAERREALRRALLEYCALDTLALVRLAHFLQAAVPTKGDHDSATEETRT